jgi:hypothetical protein
MAKQTFSAGQVLTAAEMNSLQENDYNWSVDTKTASYVLAAGDEGTRVVMNSGSATTITVDDAVFAAGDVVWLHNIGAGTCTVTAGTATVNTAASLDLAQWEGGSLYFTSASSAIFFRGPAGGVGTANFTDTETGTYSSGGKSYKYLTFTSSGTITFDTAGLADVFVLGGGGGGRTAYGAGGGGGAVEGPTIVEATTYTVTVGAGGAAGATGSAGTSSSIGSLIVCTGGAVGNLVGSASGALTAGTFTLDETFGDVVSKTFTGTGAHGGGARSVTGAGYGGGDGLTTNVTNSALTQRGRGGQVGGPVAKAANSGQGGDATGGSSTAGGSGVVIVRVEV